MARATRIALDMALVSLNMVRPVISKVWFSAKSMVASTPARVILNNPMVSSMETTLDKITSVAVAKMTVFRDIQLPKEQKYLEAELEKVKQRMTESVDRKGQRSC